VKRAVLALGLLAAAAIAHADNSATVLLLPNTVAKIEIPDRWKPTPSPGLVAAYKDERGGVLAIARADIPNADAWKSEARQAYADQIERGIKASVPGYKRVAKKLSTASGVPVFDVEATREGGATLIVRLLLFRTYALSLAIEVPAKGDIAVARALAATFAPPADYKPER
jgi:hypothetical protein